MEKTFEPDQIEKKWYSTWESNDYFAPSKKGSEGYCIMIPPPNVTGSLHMGHAFQDTLMDALIRHQRMLGKKALWQVGTDHAGIATQMVVERQIAEENLTRHDLGREAFIDRIWKWKEESGGMITKQLRRMGASVDWSRECFTMDPQLSKAVKEVFVRLYKEGLIYRGKRLVNWDPKLHTAISDLEVISEDEKGHMWHLRYPLTEGTTADNKDYLIVATTRPETMLGDTCVAVHPDDERYQNLIGKSIRLPLTDREIPIVADEYVDPEFGTGCVKITPAHDFNDYEVGQRHNMPLINIFTPDAKINEEAPKAYQGLDRFDARKQIIEDLDSQGLLEKIEDHTLKVPRGDRSKVVIEPFLTDQWYVAVKELAKPAIEAVENGDIEFVPKQWENTYFSWMRDLKDWCISRQLWWGHRIPAWYDTEGNVYVGASEEAVREENNLSNDIELKQDDDVLDTWFSSALWTFSTLGWPDNSQLMKTFHPTDVLVTGFDIIFFWVARMIMMTLKFTGEVPFKKVYVHGLIRDGEGQKMSKSKGNVLDPIDLIDGISLDDLLEKRTSNMMQPHLKQKIAKQTKKDFPDGISAFGTDALRFTFCAVASTGRDIMFDMSRIEGYRNFCNKLWNAARYVLMNVEGQNCASTPEEPYELGLEDRWIISRLQETEAAVEEAFKTYRFDFVAQHLYEFIWNEYCDWYLELSKPVLKSASEERKVGTRRTLVRVLEAILRLAHPIMPYITEEIWQRVASLAGATGETIMLQPYPVSSPEKLDPSALNAINLLKGIIVGIRTIRGEMNIPPGKPLNILLKGMQPSEVNTLNSMITLLQSVGRIADITYVSQEDQVPISATSLYNSIEILVPMKGLIDVEAERSRLTKELEKLNKETGSLKGRLGNANFVERAPAQVVEKERNRLASLEEATLTLSTKLSDLENL